MFTIDASVWVNGFDLREPDHEISRQLLYTLGIQNIPVVLPYLVLAEVAGAISRRRNNPSEGEAFAISLASLPNITFIALDEQLARQALAIASNNGLRGADAVYAAVALGAGCTLVSLDNEHHIRLQGVVSTQRPSEVLPDLLSSQDPPQ